MPGRLTPGKPTFSNTPQQSSLSRRSVLCFGYRRLLAQSPPLRRPFYPSIQPLPLRPDLPHSAPPVTLATEGKMPDQLNSDNRSLKSQTARANGAKSRGPVTPEG